MEFDIPRRWLGVNFRRLKSTIVVEALDDQDHTTQSWSPDLTPDPWEPPPGWDGFHPDKGRLPPAEIRQSCLWPTAMVEMVAGALASLPPGHDGPHSTGPVPLPVFVRPPGEERDGPWESYALQLLTGLGFNPDSIQPIRLRGKRWKGFTVRDPFRLPLRITAVGPGVDPIYYHLRDTRGLSKPDHDLQHYGIQVNLRRDLPSLLREDPCDILILTESLAARAFSLFRRSQLEIRPRVLMVFGSSKATGFSDGNTSAPTGMSVISAPLPPESFGRHFASEFVLGVVHDFPIHEAMKTAYRQTEASAQLGQILGPSWVPRLQSTPLNNHDIRMADAFEQLVREVSSYTAATNLGDIDQFAKRADLATADPLLERFLEIESQRASILKAEVVADALDANFSQETYGLWPLAEAERAAADARRDIESLEMQLQAVGDSTSMAQALELHQDRRLEARLARLEYSPLQRGYTDRGLFVSRATTLRASARYSLEVAIGHHWRSKDNLLPENLAPIDPILPPPSDEQGHLLQVVLFEDDFEVIGNRVQDIRLPQLSASTVAEFRIRAPAQLGRSGMRVAVYYHDHLVQSFRITAVVGSEERLSPDEPMDSTIEFSRTRRFTNLEEIKPRAVSIAVNQSRDSHTFMVKRGRDATPIGLSEKTLELQIGRSREVLANVVTKKLTHEEAVRNLADIGYELGQALFQRTPRSISESLRELSRSQDETIQIVRLDQEYAFPWPIVYDWEKPPVIEGGKKAPVCAGRASNGHGSCSHKPQDGVYCVRGFWGYRHSIEEFLSTNDREDAVERVEAAGNEPGVVLAIGTSDDHTARLAADLAKEAGGSIAELGSSDGLLDALWRTDGRPAVCVVVGHLRTKRRRGEPIEPRILTGTSEEFLLASDITKRDRSLGPWAQPRTLILLLACDSAVTDLGSLTTFASALSHAGALAVSGTESKVFTDVASSYGRFVVSKFCFGRLPLGRVTTDFRRALLEDLNPYAFSFRTFGSSDVVMD